MVSTVQRLHRHEHSGGAASDARERGFLGAHTRLAELGAAEVDHTWLWHLNLHHGPVLESQELVDSVLLQLGCWSRAPLTPLAAAWARPRLIPGTDLRPADVLIRLLGCDALAEPLPARFLPSFRTGLARMKALKPETAVHSLFCEMRRLETVCSS